MRLDVWSPVCVNGYTSEKGRECGRDAETKIEATDTEENYMELSAGKDATVKQENRDFGRCQGGDDDDLGCNGVLAVLIRLRKTLPKIGQIRYLYKASFVFHQNRMSS